MDTGYHSRVWAIFRIFSIKNTEVVRNAYNVIWGTHRFDEHEKVLRQNETNLTLKMTKLTDA